MQEVKNAKENILKSTMWKKTVNVIWCVSKVPQYICIGFRSYITFIKELSGNERSQWTTSIAKKPYILWFSGGGGSGPPVPLWIRPCFRDAQWRIGRVLDLRSWGRWIEANRRHYVVFLSKTLYQLLSTGSNWETFLHDWKLEIEFMKHCATNHLLCFWDISIKNLF